MVELKQLYDDLKQSISASEQEESRLGEDEEEEMKYLNREDVPRSLKIFSEEVDLAANLSEHLKNAEEDELKAEEILKEKDVPEEIRERFAESEQELEQLVKNGLEEMQTLKKEAEILENEINNSDVTHEEVEEFREDRQELEQAIENMQQVEREGKQMMNRREFLISTGVAGATAATIGKITVENMHKFQKQIKQQQQEALNQIKSSQQATKNESAKPDSKINMGDGKLKETVELKGLLIETEIIRTSADTALTIIQVENPTGEPKKLDISLSANNWRFSGAIRFTNGNSKQLEKEIQIPPGNRFSAGATLTKNNTSAGMIEYDLLTAERTRQIQLNAPSSIVSGHTVEPDQVEGIEVNQQLADGERYGEKELHLEIHNTSGTNMTVHSTLGTPSGWSFSGLENASQSAAGLVPAENKIGSGRSAGFSIYLNKQDENPPPITTLTITAMPENQPENANYYLVPVVLE